MKHNFIRTTQEHVARELRNNNFTELKKDGNFYVFLNDGKMKFTEAQKKEIIYSDILSV